MTTFHALLLCIHISGIHCIRFVRAYIVGTRKHGNSHRLHFPFNYEMSLKEFVSHLNYLLKSKLNIIWNNLKLKNLYKPTFHD